MHTGGETNAPSNPKGSARLCQRTTFRRLHRAIPSQSTRFVPSETSALELHAPLSPAHQRNIKTSEVSYAFQQPIRKQIERE